MSMQLHRGMSVDLPQLPNHLGFKALMPVESAAAWQAEILLFSGYFKKVVPEGVVTRLDPQHLNLDCSALPEVVDRVAFVLSTDQYPASSLTAECFLQDQHELEHDYLLQVPVVDEGCNAVVVMELVRRLDHWYLKAVGLTVWGGLQSIYGAN